MSCEVCMRAPCPCESYNFQQNCNHHYSDVADDIEEEPPAPNLSLGNRILWLTETSAASGIVRWIGRIPSLSPDWSAGIEFDNVMPGGGSGRFQGRIFFNSRPGHALFLPISDLIRVDDPSASSVAGERTSFFGRLQDSCSNFAHRRRRDSTFGHFKQECYSSCAQNIIHNSGHYYSHAPVYDRITSRQSRHYADLPCESYNTSNPRGPTQSPTRVVPERRKPLNNFRASWPSHTNEGFLNELSNENTSCTRYSDNQFCEASQTRKESIFYPRSTLRLINGFKEWIASFMLGTTRRKSRETIVLKDRKSVTSVFVSDSSRSVTGQRLSSFSEYASVSLSSNPSRSSKVKVNKESTDTGNVFVKEKKKSRKKRPAPLPPIQQSGVAKPKGHKSFSSVTDNANSKKENINSQNHKIVSGSAKSSANLAITSSTRKKHKKRRAPPPPTLYSAANSSIYASVPKKEHRNVRNGIACINYDNMYFPSVIRQPNNIQSQEWDKVNANKHNRRSMHKELRRVAHFNHSQLNSFHHSDADDSSSGSISFSPDESEDEKYGLVKFKTANSTIDPVDRGSSVSRASNFVQYATDNSDVCLKISIQKTETNVFTVEEVPASHTIRYVIDDDTSSSELSDEPPVIPVKTRVIASLPETKLENRVPASVENTDDASQTIFDELQIEPPVKGSVKDFVHAFNLLANKGSKADFLSDNWDPSTSQSKKMPSKTHQSLPTNWEFQNNVIFQTNQTLLPIAEESTIEVSEYDGNASAEDTGAVMRQDKHKHKKLVAHKHKTDKNDGTKKKCSHCCEKHVLSSSHNSTNKNNSVVKCMSKESNPTPGKSGSQENTIINSPSKASVAALSSLLQGKNLDSEKENNACSSKSLSKLDQPIMVGLHIEDKSSHRGPIPLLVTPSMSLRKLKKQVEVKYDFPRHQQCWILGESFAVQDDASLASYGVTETGCPVLLYVMTKEPKSCSLPCRKSGYQSQQKIPYAEDSSDEEVETCRNKKSRRRHKSNSNKGDALEVVVKDKTSLAQHESNPQNEILHKSKDNKKKPNKSHHHKAWEEDHEKKAGYRTLLALDNVDLVANTENFECTVCFMDVEPGTGVVLQDCLHCFCKECLAGAVQYSDTAIIKCPFANDEYSCESHLQEREIKCLVTPEIYERHLQRSMALAESQAQDSFHCKTPDCPGWCLFEDNVNIFRCPVCKHTNCLTCAAIHEGRNCKQYQDFVAFNCDTSEEAKKTKEYLQDMVQNGEAVECPQCQVILMKKWGCDWLKCSMCHTEVCWVTKGPRWGPGGRGDTSGGCKCMLNGARCHPKCSYCH